MLPLLYLLLNYSSNGNSCSTANVFRTARIAIDTRRDNHLLCFSIARNSDLAVGRRIKLVSAVRLTLHTTRLKTAGRSCTDRQASVRGRVTTAGRRLTGTRSRIQHCAALITGSTTGGGRLRSTRDRIGILRHRLTTRRSSLSGDADDLGSRVSTTSVRHTRILSRLSGYRVASPVANAILGGCTRTNRCTIPKAPLFRVTSIDGVFLETCVAARRLRHIGVNRPIAICTSCNNNGEGRCSNDIA